jgi:tetrahydromethanopterin S-methyltransferase subunit G
MAKLPFMERSTECRKNDEVIITSLAILEERISRHIEFTEDRLDRMEAQVEHVVQQVSDWSSKYQEWITARKGITMLIGAVMGALASTVIPALLQDWFKN